MNKPNIISRPSPNRNGYSSPHRPKCVVWHITAGSGASALSWLTNPASQASSNYLIMEDGTVYELVPPSESAWANGAVNKPNMANPIVAETLNAKRNMNTASISIEHAGQTSGGKGGSLTARQIEATIALTAWLCAGWGITPDRAHIIPHAFIDGVNRPYCPGFSEAEWDGWIGRIAALVRGDTTVKEPITGAPSASPHARIIAEMQDRLTLPQLGAVQGQGYVTVGDREIALVEFEKGRYVLNGESVEGVFVDPGNPYSFEALDKAGKVRW